MEEREKMIQGLMYNPFLDKTLEIDRLNCKTLCQEYNHLPVKDYEKRKDLMKKILSSTKENFLIEQDFMCDYGYNISVGENFFSNYNCTILDGTSVTFGDNVFIAPNCCFSTAGHAIDAEQRNKGLEIAWKITVGDNVWIGANVVVLPGVTIGSNTVIGAGSVVTKDIPSGVIAVGNPCRVMREITEQDKFKYKMAE